MTQTIVRPHDMLEARGPEIVPSSVGEVVDALGAIEQLDKGLHGDEVAGLQVEVEETIEDLVKNPNEVFAWYADYMSELYEKRSDFKKFDDGSRMQSWGTRDISKLFLDFTYVKTKRPDGTVRYDVAWRKNGLTVFRYDDGELDITYKAPRNPTLGDTLQRAPKRLVGDEAESAIRSLFDSSFAAAATTKVRPDSEREYADATARYFLDESTLPIALNEAHDVESIEHILDSYQTRP